MSKEHFAKRQILPKCCKMPDTFAFAGKNLTKNLTQDFIFLRG